MKTFSFPSRSRRCPCRTRLLGVVAALVLASALACGCGSSGNGGSTGSLTVFAGVPAGWGNVDGTGSAARFHYPEGVAVDGSGNVYVADTSNHTIRKVTPAGVVTTLAGSAGKDGSTDGTGPDARFFAPLGVAVDGSGNVYVVDATNQTVRKVTSSGVVTTLAGTAHQGGSTDGTGSAARFYWPQGAALDGTGNLYVADTGNHTIRKITPEGVVTTLAGSPGHSGTADGPGPMARFFAPTGVAVDGSGNVYVADTSNHTIRKVTPAGVVTTLAGKAGERGNADGVGAAARFAWPRGSTVDGSGNVYVADAENDTIRKVTPAGVVTTLAGSAGTHGSTDGTGSAARFYDPESVAMDGSGNLYVADSHNSTIRKITPAGMVTTLAGMGSQAGCADGTGADARFAGPRGVAVDGAGTIYVADTWAFAIRKITPAGAVTTPSFTDSFPTSVAVDASGNLYASEPWVHIIVKVSPAGAMTTLAGTAGQSGSVDGTGAAARFNFPSGVAVDGAGNVYVADTNNFTIRKITPAGDVTTVAGLAGESGGGDGTGSAARFNSPNGVAVDSLGNLYVADTGNSTIRKVTPDGAVATLAGTAGGAGSDDGTGPAARFFYPSSVAVDGSGNVYVADTYNSTIREITPAGVVTTVVGVAMRAETFTGPLPAGLAWPNAVAVDRTTGHLFIALADAVLEAQ